MFNRKQKVFLLLGAVLLLGFAYTGTVSKSPALSVALQSSQSAAAWWSQYPDYQGWPVPHFTLAGNKMCDGVNPGSFLCGWCQAPGNCPLPSYAAVYPAGNPAGAMVAKVILPGKLKYPNQAQYRPYQGPTYTGSSVSVQQGQGVTLEWACQNWQAYSFTYVGTCTSYDALGNCNGWSNGGTGQQYFYDYGPAVGIGFTAGTHVGKTTVYPTQATTYGVYCPASGWVYNQFWTPLPSTPVMSFNVTISAPPPPPPAPQLSLTPAASTVAYNGTQTLAYSATGGGGYDACYLAGGQWGGSPGTPVGTSGSATTNSLTTTTQYSYTCHDTYYNWVGPVSATVAVGAQAPTVVLAPSSQTILSGQNANFTYTLGGGAPDSVIYKVNGGPSVPASGGSFSVGNLGTGSHSVVMTASNAGGSNTSNTASVTVNAACPANCPGPGAPNCIANSGYTYNPGSNTCTFNDICTDIPGSQAFVPAGCVTPNPNPGACIPSGYFYDSALNQCVAPGLSLTAAPPRVQKGNSTTLTWAAQNITAGSCTLKNSLGATLSSAPSGSLPVVVNSQTVYTLSCGSPAGAKTKSVTVSLVPSFKEI